MARNEIEQILGRMTTKELAEIDSLLRNSQPVDRNIYPFQAPDHSYWASEFLYREACQMWPSFLLDDHDVYMAKFHRWLQHVAGFSVHDPNQHQVPKILLPMLQPNKENERTVSHSVKGVNFAKLFKSNRHQEIPSSNVIRLGAENGKLDCCT